MARMMDSLILDSLSTPYAVTKITTHRPVKKATSSTNLPAHNGSSSMRGTFNSNSNINKKIPTQGIHIYMSFHNLDRPSFFTHVNL